MGGSTGRKRGWAAVLLALAVAGACSGGGGTGPAPEPPGITVTGVEDGGMYSEPVTILVDVDRGSYTATLDGAGFLSGSTVSGLGAHRLEVTARNGTATSRLDVAFTIEAPEGGLLVVRLLDLGANDSGGGGDAILLMDSTALGNRYALVDAGPAGVGGSDPDYVARRLETLGVDTLEVAVLTHAHADHFLGLGDVLRDVHVTRFVYNGQVRSYAAYTSLVEAARARADTVLEPSDVLAMRLGSSTLTLIPPLPDHLPVYQGDPARESEALNDGSIGALLERAGFGLFLAGDGEVAANRRWRTAFGDLSRGVDALKVGHHGANDAVFDNGFDGASSWLEHTDPATLLISANGTTHPRLRALTAILGRTSARTYCTNVHGEIQLQVTALGDHHVTVERNADADCEAGSDAST